jgi:hypothetical protein
VGVNLNMDNRYEHLWMTEHTTYLEIPEAKSLLRRLVVDEDVAYHLMHNAGKSWKILENVRAPGFKQWWVASHWTVLPLDYNPIRCFVLDWK